MCLLPLLAHLAVSARARPSRLRLYLGAAHMKHSASQFPLDRQGLLLVLHMELSAAAPPADTGHGLKRALSLQSL